MPSLALALALLLSVRHQAMADASWEKLVPSAERSPEVATVHAGASLSQTLLRLGKDAALPLGRHAADGTLVLLEGELTVESGGKSFQLVPGSVLELPAGTRYAGRTKWDKKALALLTLAGPWSRTPE